MFTGIIESMGTVKAMQPTGGDIRLVIESASLDFSDVSLGDSIAANGICLTVVEFGNDYYAVDVSRETIKRTALATLQVGDSVNLEKAMLPTTRFGGHIVAGHVDGVGTVKLLKKDARSIYIEIEIPQDLAHYTATKGSITLDGISLTTNLVRDNIVCLNIIPHTAQMTNIAKHWFVGSKVNLEVDIVARYLERLLLKPQTSSDVASTQGGIDEAFLAKTGFLK
ncbi:riboflavin synthase [Psychrobacter aestuarii]|uniref:Riboflavin synthase n=1 Tax=Psychrobacter aestuarii TaxID=556327 RepID=A0ABP3FT78_9GAMM|nr:riboflavin synthase [Psychrobacter aestuarii]